MRGTIFPVFGRPNSRLMPGAPGTDNEISAARSEVTLKPRNRVPIPAYNMHKLLACAGDRLGPDLGSLIVASAGFSRIIASSSRY